MWRVSSNCHPICRLMGCIVSRTSLLFARRLSVDSSRTDVVWASSSHEGRGSSMRPVKRGAALPEGNREKRCRRTRVESWRSTSTRHPRVLTTRRGKLESIGLAQILVIAFSVEESLQKTKNSNYYKDFHNFIQMKTEVINHSAYFLWENLSLNQLAARICNVYSSTNTQSLKQG